jgi:heme exporter protein B
MWDLLIFFLREEWKNKFNIMASLLFIFSAALIAYLSLPSLDSQHFSAVFWIVVIFTTLQGISKAFLQMRKQHYLFWHQLYSAEQFLAARIIQSSLLMLVYTLMALLLFNLFFDIQLQAWMAFTLSCILTGIGISSIFTISSSIASKTDQPSVLMPVLSFPILLPIILVGSKAGSKALQDLGTNALLVDWTILLSIDTLIVLMGIFLIRFIWKD